MPINYETYKETIKQASINARKAESIDEALEIQAAGFAAALQVAVGQMLVETTGTVQGHATCASTGTVT